MNKEEHQKLLQMVRSIDKEPCTSKYRVNWFLYTMEVYLEHLCLNCMKEFFTDTDLPDIHGPKGSHVTYCGNCSSKNNRR